MITLSLKAICSGGQTGADQGGLCAAEQIGIYTFGWAPKGFKTEAGPAPWLGERFNLMEHASDDYKERTKANVLASTGTLIFGHRSRGSNWTEEWCRQQNKPCCWVYWYSPEDDRWSMPASSKPSESPALVLFNPQPIAIQLWLKRSKIDYLNVAGNRESKNPGIFQYTKDMLVRVLS